MAVVIAAVFFLLGLSQSYEDGSRALVVATNCSKTHHTLGMEVL